MTGLVRRHRAAWVIGGVAVVAAVLSVLAGGGDTGTTTPLDPANPGPEGARAVARVLEGDGVDVTVARGAEELEDLVLDGDATVVVTSAENLAESTVRRLRDHVGGRRLVVVEPPPLVVEELDGSVQPSSLPEAGRVEADCSHPLLRDLSLQVDHATGFRGGAAHCFPVDGSYFYTETDDGVALLGAGQILTNDQVTRADNAAAALRLLGQSRSLVWYVADLSDQTAGDSVSLRSLLPPWILPGLWVGLLALVLLVVWRGRRLGPLVTEPLPVVVRAIESTRGRGQLYRRANDRRHAADALRRQATGRLAARLHMPRSVAGDPELVATEVSRISGRPVQEIRDLLDGRTTPGSDQDLVRLARQLAEIEEQVENRT